MKLLVTASGILIAVLGLLWFGAAKFGLHLPFGIKLTITIVLVVCWIALAVTVWLRRTKQQAQASPMTKTFVRGASGVSEMNDQFQKAFNALKSTRPTALTQLPWYLVIGGSGSGKTTMLHESGLSFVSFGAGSSYTGAATRSCDWWFTEEAVLLDTAGRYISDNTSLTEWKAFLDLVRQARPELALNGVLIAVSVPDLIKKDEAGVAAEAQRVRDRIADLNRLFALEVPFYVVFTKCDMIGGFKDFFASLPPAEREQVWGTTLPWPSEPAADVRGQFQREVASLLPALRTRRMGALSAGNTAAGGGEQQYKILQFPHQFASVGKWMGDFLAALLRPGQGEAAPALRGFYFTSAHQAARPAAAPAAAPQPAAQPAQRANLEGSIFIQANSPQLAAQTSERNQGLFLKDMLAKQVLGDQHLVRVAPAVRRRRQLMRGSALIGSAVGLLAFAIWLAAWFSEGRGLINGAIAASQKVVDTARVEAGKLGPNLGALDDLRAALAALDRHSSGGAQRARAQGYSLYYTQLKRWFLVPAGDRIRGELEKLRTAQGKTLTTYDEINDLFRCYLMLSGDDKEAPPDRELLERRLGEGDRWLAGVSEPGKPVDPAIATVASQQLAHFLGHLGSTEGWAIPVDRPLVERIKYELGEALWIAQSYDDVVSTLQAAVAKVGRDAVIPAVSRELVVSDYEFPVLFTQAGWDQTMTSAIAEKAEGLFRKYQALKIDKSKDAIAERLRARYSADVTRHWLRLVTGVKPARAQDLREAAANLRALVSPQSPWRDLLRGAWQGMQVRFSAADLRPVAGDADFKWIEDSLTALAEFQGEVDQFATGTDTGRRSLELVRLQKLQAAYEAAWTKVGAALRTIDAADRRSAALQAFENLTAEIHRVLSAEVTAEQDAAWAQKVHKPFAAELASRFPFDRASKTDAPLAAFSKMFNPKSGLATLASTEVENLRKLKFAGRDLLPVNRDYERLAERAKEIRTALYPDNAVTIDGAFTLTLMQREGVKDVRVVIGAEAFGLYDRPDRRGQFKWKESDTLGAKLSINVVSDQWLTLDYTGQPFGLIRLLRDGQPTPRPEGGQLCTWTFAGKAIGKDVTFNAGAVLEANGLERLVPAEFFGTLVCPERVGR